MRRSTRVHDHSVPAQVPDLSAAQARMLYTAGWRDAAALALAEPGAAAKALVGTLPNSMRGGKRSANGKAKANDVRRVTSRLALQSCKPCAALLTCPRIGKKHGAVDSVVMHTQMACLQRWNLRRAM